MDALAASFLSCSRGLCQPMSASVEYDLVVIGGGINGAAVAREAALRGIRTLLVERGDVGCGTSSASSRLIHGGLRYLEYAELGLVHESLSERERLLKHAPHLVAPLELHIPIYERSRRKPWQIRIGLGLYDLLSRGKSVPGHTMLSRDELLGRMPGLSRDGLVAGAAYFDAQCAFPERLVVENVRDAVDHGAVLMTYTEVTRIRVEGGRATGVEWRTTDGEPGTAGARVVVNAAGPWVDQVLGEIAHTRLVGGTKGSHIIVPRWADAPKAGVYVEAASDGRPFFILPWNGLVLIGTTDERITGDPGAVEASPQEIAYLASETERVFPAAAGLAERICYTHTGVRPLPYKPRGAAGAITRRHIVRRHRSARGAYSIVGGKLTTHRALAEDVLRYVGEVLPAAKRASSTRSRPLPGALASADRDELLRELGAAFGAHQAARLWSVYGAAARQVAGLARERGLAAELDADGMLAAEAVYALEHEWARTLVDILNRRTMAGLAADFGLRAAAACARHLQAAGIWDAPRAADELAAYREYARRHGAIR